MRLDQRQRQLGALLAEHHRLWHPQPFRDARPAWCEGLPDLATALLALDDDATEHLASDGDAGLAFVAAYLPELPSLAPLTVLPAAPPAARAELGAHWDWEIPGRKRQQIEAFAGAASASGLPVLDWCGGKGHLGRLLALQWQVPATSLEIDPVLCREGEALAKRGKVLHSFVTADALATNDLFVPRQHLVALHACGDLHRHAVVKAAGHGVRALDIAPCCYYRGVAEHYRPLAAGADLALSRDDLRLAVTETVTASPRLRRQRDRGIAWKLGFDAWRRQVDGDSYRPFKPVKAPWLRAPFAEFCSLMAEREGLPMPTAADAERCEAAGWCRQREVQRLSIVRHAFRRGLEIWLAGDLALHLQETGYQVTLQTFCPRHLTPRNLLLSARR